MTEQSEQSQGMINEQKVDLLASVNTTLASLQSTMKYKRILDAIPGCEALKGKKIAMVDDVLSVLENFVEPLMIATQGNASFIQYKGQLMDELMQEILAKQPEIILVDFHLSEKIKGDAIVRELSQQSPEISCIGFSSDPDAKQAFLQAGVKGVVPKDTSNPNASLQAVAASV